MEDDYTGIVNVSLFVEEFKTSPQFIESYYFDENTGITIGVNDIFKANRIAYSIAISYAFVLDKKLNGIIGRGTFNVATINGTLFNEPVIENATQCLAFLFWELDRVFKIKADELHPEWKYPIHSHTQWCKLIKSCPRHPIVGYYLLAKTRR